MGWDFDLSEAVEKGFSFPFTSKGLKFWGMLFVASLIYQIGIESFTGTEMVLSVGILPNPLLGVVFVVFSYLSYLFVYTALARALDSDDKNDDISSYFNKMFFPVIYLFLGSLMYIVGVGIGSILLLVPGVLFAIAFIFYLFPITLESKNPGKAFNESLELAKGNFLGIFFFMLIFLGIGIGFMVLVWILSMILFFTMLGEILWLNFAVGVVIEIFNGLLYLIGFSALYSVYSQLRTGE